MIPENERGLHRLPLGIVRFQMAKSTWSQLSTPSMSIRSCDELSSLMLTLLIEELVALPEDSCSSSSSADITRGPLIAHIPIVISLFQIAPHHLLQRPTPTQISSRFHQQLSSPNPPKIFQFLM
jgi:hypothetical protein